MGAMEHLKLLGMKTKDTVTGHSGVVTSISYDLYGCIQAVVQSPQKKGEIPSGIWFDVLRLKVTDNTPVMEPPDFADAKTSQGIKGPAEKPIPA